MKKLLIVDNYDSFTYNLVHIIEQSDWHFDVVRNDVEPLPDFSLYRKILLSPGPGLPKEAGRLMEIIEKNYREKSMLGICLGHQALAEFFGATLINLQEVLHGIETAAVVISEDTIYQGLPDTFSVGRYHSWTVSPQKFPDELVVTAVDNNGCILSFRHKTYDCRGIQFHPESVMTQYGREIILNWLKD